MERRKRLAIGPTGYIKAPDKPAPFASARGGFLYDPRWRYFRNNSERGQTMWVSSGIP